MTYDLTITGGTVVDGSGRPPQRADIGIVGDRIVAIGSLDGAGRTRIDATDLIVAPGVIDVHTHYDAQAFWDPTLSPSPLHGVTTVFAGNCGFSIAPLGAGGTVDRGDAEYLMHMLARVEGMPIESLAAGVPWDWVSTAEYFDRLDGTLVPNAGFLVGHSALRRVVMHDAANQRHATAAEIEAMADLLRAGLAAGGMGFSSTWSPSHNDHLGHPVPSRLATREEILALCAVVSEFPGTTLEFIPGVGPFSDELFDLMAAMSRTANRPLNWNVLQVNAHNVEHVGHQLGAGDYAAEHGGRVLALTLPDSLRMRLNLRSGFVLDLLTGWDELMALPDADKLRCLADPTERARWNALAQSSPPNLRNLADWDSFRLVETETAWAVPYVGATLAELAAGRGTATWDTLAELACADRLRTVISPPDRGMDRASWVERVRVWRDPRSIVGASDAGAHLDMIDSFGFATTLLAKAVREHELLPVEEAVQLLTARPADLYGVRDRGRLQVGAYADVQVFDLATVGPQPVATRYDLPGDAGRIYGGATGMHHVVVNGRQVVEGSEFCAARPGKLLRAGVDTATVTAAS